MKILLTGSRGQLGMSLQAALARHELVALDHAQLDITKLDEVRQALASHHPALVINSAGYNAVDQAEDEPERAYHVNAVGPRNLAIATAACGITLLHVSTDYVFDGQKRTPYDEFDFPSPLSVYGASKLAGEEAVRMINPRHYVVRTAWLYHPAGRNFLTTMHRLAHQPTVRVAQDQWGSPTLAPHLAQAIAQLIETETFGIFHLAGRGGASRYELVKRLYAELGISTPVVPVSQREFPQRARRPAYSVLTTLQEPQILLPPWEDGVAEFAQRYVGTGVSYAEILTTSRSRPR